MQKRFNEVKPLSIGGDPQQVIKKLAEERQQKAAANKTTLLCNQDSLAKESRRKHGHRANPETRRAGGGV
jgi:hypothetical protein